MAPAGNVACLCGADDLRRAHLATFVSVASVIVRPGCELMAWWSNWKTNRGEPARAREPRAAILYSVGPVRNPDHEAAMRFGSGAPRRWAHSDDRSFQPRSGSGHYHLGSSSATRRASAAGG